MAPDTIILINVPMKLKDILKNNKITIDNLSLKNILNKFPIRIIQFQKPAVIVSVSKVIVV